MLDEKRKKSWQQACKELAKLAETEFFGEVRITAHQGLFCDLYITDHIKLTRLEKLNTGGNNGEDSRVKEGKQ